MADEKNLTLSLTCAICLDIASVDNVVETCCCHQLYCLPCIDTVKECPTCRQVDVKTVPAYFARRLIGDLVVACPNTGCSAKITRADLAKHLSNYCQFTNVTCPDSQCKNLKCTRKCFLEHLITEHEQLLLDNFSKLWQKQETFGTGSVIRTENESTSEYRSYLESLEFFKKKHFYLDVVQAAPTANSADSITFDDRIEETRNIFGRGARLGSTGKFYCTGRLDGFRCSCCNGQCGPTNGCNCSGCMLLDVQKRKLSRGWLVNSDGASARCSPEEPTKFYCGRRVMTHDRRTNGYCGPTNGNQCDACLKLTNQQHRRYGQIWS